MIHPTYTHPGVPALLLKISQAQRRAATARRSMFAAWHAGDTLTTNTQMKYAGIYQMQAGLLLAQLQRGAS